MTSNIGSDIILQAKEITSKIKEQVEALLHKMFRPEFLNRIDAIVFFKRLDKRDVEHIAQIQLQHLVERLTQRNITLNYSEQVIDYIAKLGYSPEFGARPLKRALQQHIMVPISQYLLKHPQTATISLSVKGENLIIS